MYINIFELTGRRNEHIQVRQVVSSTINSPCFFKKASVFIFSDELAAVLECLKKSIILTREEGLPLSRRISDTRLGSAFLDSFKYPVCHLLSPSPVTVSACCRQVLGCSTYIDQCFAENNRCLHCCAENAQERTVFCMCLVCHKSCLIVRQVLKKTNEVSNNYHKKICRSEK